jgi:hypothetical protein
MYFKIQLRKYFNNHASKIPDLMNENESTINDRIEALILAKEKGRQKNFADTVKVAPTTINSLVSGRRGDPSYTLLKKIMKAYPDVSESWLMHGEGEMFSKDNEPKVPVSMFNELKGMYDKLKQELDQLRLENQSMRTVLSVLDKLGKYRGILLPTSETSNLDNVLHMLNQKVSEKVAPKHATAA